MVLIHTHHVRRSLTAGVAALAMILTPGLHAVAQSAPQIDSTVLVRDANAFRLVWLDTSDVFDLVQGDDLSGVTIDGHGDYALTLRCVGSGTETCTVDLVDLRSRARRTLGTLSGIRRDRCYPSVGFSSDGTIAWSKVLPAATCGSPQTSLYPLRSDDSVSAHPLFSAGGDLWTAGRRLDLGRDSFGDTIAPDGKHLFVGRYGTPAVPWVFDAAGNPLHSLPNVWNPQVFGDVLAWTSEDGIVLTDADGSNPRQIAVGVRYIQIWADPNGLGILGEQWGPIAETVNLSYTLDWVGADGSVRTLGDGEGYLGNTPDAYAYLAASRDRVAFRTGAQRLGQSTAWHVLDLSTGETWDVPDEWTVHAISPQGHYALLGRDIDAAGTSEAAILDITSAAVQQLGARLPETDASFSPDERFILLKGGVAIKREDGTPVFQGPTGRPDRSSTTWARPLFGDRLFAEADGP